MRLAIGWILGQAAGEERVWVAKRFGLGAADASIVVSNQAGFTIGFAKTGNYKQ